MSNRKADQFQRQQLVSAQTGVPVYTGHALVTDIGGEQVILMTPTKRTLAKAFWNLTGNSSVPPDLERVYPVGLIHRNFIETDSDIEEL